MPSLTPKYAATLWLFLILLVGFGGYRAFSREWLETGFLALLPASEQKPEIAKIIAQRDALINRKLIWMVGASTAEASIAQAQRLKLRLQQSGLFSSIMLEVPQQQFIDQYQELFPHRYQLLDKPSQQLLAADPQKLIDQSLATLYSPMGQIQAAALERDPLFLFSQFFTAQNPLKLNIEQGIVVVHGDRRYWAMLLSDLENTDLKLDKLEALQKLVNNEKSQTTQANGTLLVSGVPLFTAQGSQSAQNEISTIGFGSSAGIFLLLVMTFRSIKPLILSFLAIGCGMVAALIVTILLFGKIHILTLVFGASLIGVADDYAQHFLCDSYGEKNWDPQKSLRFILPALFIGLLSNLLSYAGLGFSPFSGLQQMAVFSAAGLIVAWLTVILLFPYLLTGFSFHHVPGILKLTRYWEETWPLWLVTNQRWLSILTALILVGGIGQLTPQDDVRLLQSVSPELMQETDKIRQLLPVSPEKQFFIVEGKNQQDWYQNEQKLLEQLDTLKQQQVISHFDAISSFWPSIDRQQANYRLLKQALYESGLLQDYMAKLGFSKADIQNEHKAFSDAEGKTLSLEAWLKTTDESKQQLWLGCDNTRCSSLVTLINIKDLAKLADLQKLPGITWIDQVDQLSSLFKRYRIRASYLLLGAFGLAWLGFTLKFGWRNACKITAVPLAALAVSLAMLGWFGQLFSLFNLFALLLVLGIGVDYAIFFFISEGRRTSTSLGVTLSALTTLLAFGLLAASSTELVHAFGFTVAWGIITALVVAPLIGVGRLKV